MLHLLMVFLFCLPKFAIRYIIDWTHGKKSSKKWNTGVGLLIDTHYYTHSSNNKSVWIFSYSRMTNLCSNSIYLNKCITVEEILSLLHIVFVVRGTVSGRNGICYLENSIATEAGNDMLADEHHWCRWWCHCCLWYFSSVWH